MSDDEEEPEAIEIPPGPLICVACGADDVVPVCWGFSAPGETAPGLMRVLNVCETCRGYVGKAILGEDLKIAKRTARELKSYLTKLVDSCSDFLDAIDKLMEKPPSNDRGRALAKLTNKLNLARDVARRFGLGGK